MTLDISRFSYIEEALNRVFPDNEAAQAEYEALLKAATQTKSFWRLIEECPRERGKAYFVWAKSQGLPTIGVTWSDEGFRKFDFYAEVPPLPKEDQP